MAISRPQNLQALAESATVVTLSWTHGGGANQMEVQRASASSGFTRVAMLPGTARNYRDTYASPSTTYSYRVRAKKGQWSSWSVMASVTTPAATQPPTEPPTEPPTTPPRIVYGSAGIEPLIQGAAAIPKVVGLRYRQRFDAHEAWRITDKQAWKILFTFISTEGPAGWMHHAIELLHITGSMTWVPDATGRFVAYRADGVTVPRPPGYVLHPEWMSMTVNTPNMQMERGTRASNIFFFPGYEMEIDGLPNAWKQQHEAQKNFMYIDHTVDVRRMGTTTEVNNWSGRGPIAPGTRRVWRTTITPDDTREPQSVDIAIPTGLGEYLKADKIVEYVTEAFCINPGWVRFYLWGFEVQQEGSASWIPLRTFRCHASDMDPANNTWGHRVGSYGGHPALEVSNDGTKTYLRPGETLTI